MTQQRVCQHDGGELTSAQHDDSDELAEILAETVLSLQDDAPAGMLAGVAPRLRLPNDHTTTAED